MYVYISIRAQSRHVLIVVLKTHPKSVAVFPLTVGATFVNLQVHIITFVPTNVVEDCRLDNTVSPLAGKGRIRWGRVTGQLILVEV